MKGYETSSRKAQMLLNLLRRMPRSQGGENGYESETTLHARRAHSM